MNKVRCCNCNWQGTEDDLEQFDDSNGGGYGCPNCRTDGYLVDVEKSDIQQITAESNPEIWSILQPPKDKD